MPKHIFGAHANICRIRIFVYILVQILQITRQRSLATPQNKRTPTRTHTPAAHSVGPVCSQLPLSPRPPATRVMHNVFACVFVVHI